MLSEPRVTLSRRNGPLSAQIDIETCEKSHRRSTLSLHRKKKYLQGDETD